MEWYQYLPFVLHSDVHRSRKDVSTLGGYYRWYLWEPLKPLILHVGTQADAASHHAAIVIMDQGLRTNSLAKS